MITLFVTQMLDLNAYKFKDLKLEKSSGFLHSKMHSIHLLYSGFNFFRDIFFFLFEVNFYLASYQIQKKMNTESKKKIMDLKMREEQMDEDSFIE